MPHGPNDHHKRGFVEVLIESDRVELILQKINRRVLDYGWRLFVCGFVIGLFVAWMLTIY
jgi:hypothetical protein